MPTDASRPRRPWGDPEPEPPPQKRWWAIRRIEKKSGARHNRMFRHPSLESARREANYLSVKNPRARFVILEAVEVWGPMPVIEVEGETTP